MPCDVKTLQQSYKVFPFYKLGNEDQRGEANSNTELLLAHCVTTDLTITQLCLCAKTLNGPLFLMIFPKKLSFTSHVIFSLLKAVLYLPKRQKSTEFVRVLLLLRNV